MIYILFLAAGSYFDMYPNIILKTIYKFIEFKFIEKTSCEIRRKINSRESTF